MVLLNDQVEALKRAVEAWGNLNYVGLGPHQYAEFLQALGCFMGGPVDAFVGRVTVSRASSDEYSALWLRGDSIGLLTVGKPKKDGDPPELSGWVRPLSSIRQLKIGGAEFYWAPGAGTNVLEEVRPTVRIHFRDEVEVIVEVKVAGRPDHYARGQAATFIERLQDALAGQSGEESPALGAAVSAAGFYRRR
jgi:hypothetical protein